MGKRLPSLPVIPCGTQLGWRCLGRIPACSRRAAAAIDRHGRHARRRQRPDRLSDRSDDQTRSGVTRSDPAAHVTTGDLRQPRISDLMALAFFPRKCYFPAPDACQERAPCLTSPPTHLHDHRLSQPAENPTAISPAICQTPRQSGPAPLAPLRRPHPRRLPVPGPGHPRQAPLPHAWRPQHRAAHRRGPGPPRRRPHHPWRLRRRASRLQPPPRHLPPPQPGADVRGDPPRPPATRARCSDEPAGAGAGISAPAHTRHHPRGGLRPAAGGDGSPCTMEAGHRAGPGGPSSRPRRPRSAGRNGSASAGKTPCTRSGGRRRRVGLGAGTVCPGGGAVRLRGSAAKTPCTNSPGSRPTRAAPCAGRRLCGGAGKTPRNRTRFARRASRPDASRCASAAKSPCTNCRRCRAAGVGTGDGRCLCGDAGKTPCNRTRFARRASRADAGRCASAGNSPCTNSRCCRTAGVGIGAGERSCGGGGKTPCA